MSAPAVREGWQPSSWWPPVALGGALIIRLAFFGGLLGWDDLAYWDVARSHPGRYDCVDLDESGDCRQTRPG